MTSLDTLQMTSPEGAGTSPCSGDVDHARLLSALLLLRGLNHAEDLHLASGVSDAGEFGDVVFVFREEDKQITACFVRQRLRSGDADAVQDVFHHMLKCYVSFDAIQKWLPKLEAQLGITVDNVELIHYTDAVFNSERSSVNPDHILDTGGLILSLSNNSQSFAFFDDLTRLHNILQDLPSDIDEREILSPKFSEFKASVNSVEILNILDHIESDPTHKETLNSIRDSDLVNANKFGLFLERIKLFHSQANEKKLLDATRDEFIKLCGGSLTDLDTIFKKFLKDIKKWTKNNNNSFLTKDSLLCRNTGHSIVSALSEVKDKCFGGVDLEFSVDSMELLKECIGRHRVVSVIADDDSVELSALKVHQALEGVSHLSVSLGTLLSRRREVVKAWKSSWCNLLVVESETADMNETRTVMSELSRVLHTPEKKFVFLTKQRDNVVRKCCKGIYGGYYEHPDTTVLSNFSEGTLKNISKRKVVYQGTSRTLHSLFQSDPNITQRIRGKILMSLLTSTEEIIIGCSIPPMITSYLSRNITRSVAVRKEFLDSKQSNAVYVFSGATNSDLACVLPYGEKACTCSPPSGEEYVISESPFIMLNNRSDEELFRVCMNEEDTDAHCFNVNDGVLEWKWSKGDVRSLEKFTMNELRQSYRENIASTVTDDVVLIVGEPRVGKSTLLQHLALEIKKTRPDTWVVCLNLGDHISYINSTVFDKEEKVLELLEHIVCVGEHKDNTLEKMVFRRSLTKSGNVEILIDGYEHLPHFLVGKVVSVLKYLQEMQIKRLWTTCSPIFKELLQQTLHVLPFYLDQFSKEDQKCFLMNVWKTSLPDRDRLERFVNAGLGLLNDSLGSEETKMSGISLQTVMFAESFESELNAYISTNVITLSSRLNLIQLYDKFVEKMCVDFLRYKLEGDVLSQQLIIGNKISLTEKYMTVALVITLYEDDLKHMDFHSIQYKYNTYLADFKNNDVPGSLLKMSDGKPQFTYPNLAEYFVALWISEVYITIGEFLEKKFFHPRLQSIRTWFDHVLAKNCELHTAVLNNDKDKTLYLLERGVDVNKTDKGGRTALHLAAMYDLRDITRLLLMKGANVNHQDKIMNWRPVRYADVLESWGALEMFLISKGKPTDLVHTTEIMRDDSLVNKILSLACTEGYIGLIAFVFSHTVDVKKFIGPEESTALHLASKYGQTETVKYLIRHEVDMMKYGKQYGNIVRYIGSTCRTIECRADLDVKTVGGYTPLMLASKKGNLSTVICLVNLGANVNAQSADGLTPLHLAAGAGFQETVEYLVKSRADVNFAGHDGVSALHLAAHGGHTTAAKVLVQSGAKINSIDCMRSSPLHWACKSGHFETVQYLIEFGAVVNIRNNERYTPLHLAAGNGHVNTVKCLLNVGAEVNIISNDNATPVHLAALEKNANVLVCLEEAGVGVNVVNSEGSTPLHWACREGHRPTVLCLIECGADMNVVNNDGYTPLHLTAWRGRTAAARCLLESGAAIDASMRCDPPVTHLAARGGHTATLQCLLEAGAAVNTKDFAGSTPLHWAAWGGHSDTVKCLLDSGADFHLLDNNGSSALHWAAGEGHAEVTKALLNAGAPTNVSNQDGEVPAHWAAKEGQLSTVQVLIDAGADVNFLNVDDLTPLHIAIQESNVSLIECLLNAGADVTC